MRRGVDGVAVLMCVSTPCISLCPCIDASVAALLSLPALPALLHRMATLASLATGSSGGYIYKGGAGRCMAA